MATRVSAGFSFSFFLWTRPLQVAGTPRHVCKTFHAIIRRSDCVGPISSHIWFYTETKRTTMQFTHVSRTKGKGRNAHAVFWRYPLKFGARVLWTPTQPLMIFFFFCSPQGLDVLRPKYRIKKSRKDIWWKTQDSFVNRWVGAHTRTCVPNFRVSQKNVVRRALDAEQIWLDMLEPACYLSVVQIQPRKHMPYSMRVVPLPPGTMSCVGHTSTGRNLPALKDLNHKWE